MTSKPFWYLFLSLQMPLVPRPVTRTGALPLIGGHSRSRGHRYDSVLANTSAFVTFLAIAAFGFVFLIASSILGDVFEHGDFGHDADGHGAGPSLLSSRILSVFVTAFGSFGAIGIHLGYGVGVSTAMGFGGGVLFAGVIYAVRQFSLQPASLQPCADQ